MSNETGQPDVSTANVAVNRPGLPLLSLVPFLLITFMIAWGILALYIFLPDQMAGVFGQLTGQHPLFFLPLFNFTAASLTSSINHFFIG